jgi:hypothetical protein
LNSKITIDKHIGHMQEAIWLGVIATIAIFIVIENLVINSIGGHNTGAHFERYCPEKKGGPRKNSKNIQDLSTKNSNISSPLHDYHNYEIS